MKLQYLKKGKEVRSDIILKVWCIKCKVEGNYKEQFPIYRAYLGIGMLSPLKPRSRIRPSIGPHAWCMLCEVVCQHSRDFCNLLQNFVRSPKKLFYNFYSVVGHYEKHCKSYDMMMQNSHSAYRA